MIGVDRSPRIHILGFDEIPEVLQTEQSSEGLSVKTGELSLVLGPGFGYPFYYSFGFFAKKPVSTFILMNDTSWLLCILINTCPPSMCSRKMAYKSVDLCVGQHIFL